MEKKELTPENVAKAMKLIQENQHVSCSKIVELLDNNGYGWSLDEVREKLCQDNPQTRLGDGIKSGDIPTGATIVANCYTEYGWDLCKDWAKAGDFQIWINAYEKRENVQNFTNDIANLAKSGAQTPNNPDRTKTGNEPGNDD